MSSPFQLFLQSQMISRKRKIVTGEVASFRTPKARENRREIQRPSTGASLITNFQQEQGGSARCFSRQQDNRDEMGSRAQSQGGRPFRKKGSPLKQKQSHSAKSDFSPTLKSARFCPVLGKKTIALYNHLMQPHKLQMRHPKLIIRQMTPKPKSSASQLLKHLQPHSPSPSLQQDDYYKLISLYQTKYSPKRRFREQRNTQRRDLLLRGSSRVEPLSPWEEGW